LRQKLAYLQCGVKLKERPAVKPQMRLAFDLSWTHLDGRWRMPGSWVGRTFPDLRMFQEVAQLAERGRVDMIFFGDGTGIPASWQNSADVAVRWGIGWPRQDMSPFIAALAQTTRHVGFGLTYASTFMHPFYTARLLNSLDHVTNGRIAFNVITSTRRADAANYGFDELMEHGARYDRMEEFIDVCKALWDSVAPDALVWDFGSGQVADPAKVRPINHVGRFFKVRGPLNCVPSPQGHPVLIQAGGSPRGVRASAHVADMVFGATKPLDLQVRQRHDLNAALVTEGRDPSRVGILWDILVVVGETEREAIARRELLLNMVPMEAVGAFLSHHSGYDFSKLPARFSLRELNEQIAAMHASPVGFIYNLAHELGETTELTREEFFEHGLRDATGYHHTFAGSAAQVADRFEEIFEATGESGGFMIAHPQAMPRELHAVVDFLIPELRRRGRFRTEYEGKTLRENLGIPPVKS
jgi:FMN-dependent oxidoreductase (nitrilotriacetate monooxygenase family)